MDDAFIIIISFIFVGAILILLGIPLLLGKIKPNWLYGFRLPSIVRNEDIWYKINKQVGRDLIIAGVVIIIGMFILLILKSYFTINQLIIISLLLVNIPLIIAIIRGLVLLKKLKNQ